MTTSSRNAELRRILEKRRREILDELQHKMRDARALEGSGGVVDEAEIGKADIDDDMSFALVQMRSETLAKIDEALTRLDQGKYGECFECEDEISERRLRALPFAVRCFNCETKREIAEGRSRLSQTQRSQGLLFTIDDL